MLKTHTSLLGALIVAILLGSAGPVLAGPPLICHPFETGEAALLSWGHGSGWNTPDPAYDVRRLTADTLRVLTSDAPVLARMENLRRATIYAMGNAAIAHELLGAVMGRALSPDGGGSPQAWFDAGYLIEAYRQAVFLRAASGDRAAWAATDETMRGVNGYGFVKKALQIAKSGAEMEYAASLMTSGAVSSAHRDRAIAAAPSGSLLAQNLSK
jgi:hypothetical protein